VSTDVTDEALSKAIGRELRLVRGEKGWSRAELVSMLRSGIGERTLLSYEHGTRAVLMVRLVEICAALSVAPTEILDKAYKRALHATLDLHVDLRQVLDDDTPMFRSMHRWARNKLNESLDGVVDVTPLSIRELAMAAGLPQNKLADYLARHVLDADDCRCVQHSTPREEPRMPGPHPRSE
jgi:transcriptional regulator with XRE-family HTH domain